MRRGEDLAALVAETQAQADDASHDQNYVVPSLATFDLNSGVGAVFDDGSDEMPSSRVEAIQFAVVQAICIRRANGAIGRGIVTAKWEDQGLTLFWRFATSAAEVFEIYRDGA